MGILVFDGPDGSILDLLPSDRGMARVQSQPATVATVTAPFKGTFYSDPAFVGTSTGSESNPFTSVAAAFAAALAIGLTNAIVYTQTTSENIVFPSTGTWELAGCPDNGAIRLNGTVNMTPTASASRTLRNLTVAGAVSGVAPNGTSNLAQFSNCTLGTVSLTGAGTGQWQANFTGDLLGSVGTCTVAGAIYARDFGFTSAISVQFASEWHDCFFQGGLTCASAALVTFQFLSCIFVAAVTFTVTGGGTLNVLGDVSSISQLLQFGATTSGLVNILSGFSGYTTRSNFTGNAGPQNMGGPFPLSLMTCTATLTVLTPGTAGNAVFNVNYTDLSGALVTKAVTPALNIASAAGTEVQGTFSFSQNGATKPVWSVTGITTPGALSYSMGYTLRPR